MCIESQRKAMAGVVGGTVHIFHDKVECSSGEAKAS